MVNPLVSHAGEWLHSSFIWTNETLNIWSHVIGFLYFSYLFLEDNFSFLPNNGGTWKDHLVFCSFNFCFQVYGKRVSHLPLP